MTGLSLTRRGRGVRFSVHVVACESARLTVVDVEGVAPADVERLTSVRS